MNSAGDTLSFTVWHDHEVLASPSERTLEQPVCS
jgi:hypothetical protein